jgi:hypothetical protein
MLTVPESCDILKALPYAVFFPDCRPISMTALFFYGNPLPDKKNSAGIVPLEMSTAVTLDKYELRTGS